MRGLGCGPGIISDSEQIARLMPGSGVSIIVGNQLLTLKTVLRRRSQASAVSVYWQLTMPSHKLHLTSISG